MVKEEDDFFHGIVKSIDSTGPVILVKELLVKSSENG